MAGILRIVPYLVITLVVHFPFRYKNTAQGNIGTTSTIQFTASSSKSVDVLSPAAPTKVTTGNSSNFDSSELECPDGVKCSDLGGSCITCDFNEFNFTCVYGKDVEVECRPIIGSIKCTVGFLRLMIV